MGIYLNPGNNGFQRIVNSEYVDKTGLLRLVNDVMDTVDNLICVSRPRRFGKSFAAKRRRISMADVPNEIVNAVHKELKNMVPELAAGESFTSKEVAAYMTGILPDQIAV